MTPPRTNILQRLRAFGKDDSGNAAVEYSIIFLPLVFFVLFIFEMSLAYHWIISAQKGVERGARQASVMVPVVNELTRPTGLGPRVITRDVANGGDLGGACYLSHCTPLPVVGCSGGTRLSENDGGGITCDAARFQDVFQEVKLFASEVEPEDVTVIYEDLELGYAGEPYVALVTVQIRARAFPLALGLFSSDTQLPAVSASLVTEELVN